MPKLKAKCRFAANGFSYITKMKHRDGLLIPNNFHVQENLRADFEWSEKLCWCTAESSKSLESAGHTMSDMASHGGEERTSGFLQEGP